MTEEARTLARYRLDRAREAFPVEVVSKEAENRMKPKD
jgi:hypothetical protein